MSGVVYALSTLNVYIAFATSQRGVCYYISGSSIKRDALTKLMGSAPHICTDPLENHSYSRRWKRERKYVENGKMLISSTRTGTVTEK